MSIPAEDKPKKTSQFLIASLFNFKDPFINLIEFNDELKVKFVVYKTEVAEAYGRVYDLSGRMVAKMSKGKDRFGNIYTWDSRDDHDKFVAPGIYLVQITIDTDISSESVMQNVSVIY